MLNDTFSVIFKHHVKVPNMRILGVRDKTVKLWILFIVSIAKIKDKCCLFNLQFHSNKRIEEEITTKF